MHCLSDHFYDKASFIIIIIIWSWIYYIIHYTFEISSIKLHIHQTLIYNNYEHAIYDFIRFVALYVYIKKSSE